MYAREDEGGGTIKSFHYLNWVLRVGTCNQFFFFWFPRPHLASPAPHHESSLLSSSRPRDLTEMSREYERGLSRSRQTLLWETLLFSHATTVGYIFAHFITYFLQSRQVLNVTRLVIRDLDLIFFSSYYISHSHNFTAKKFLQFQFL